MKLKNIGKYGVLSAVALAGFAGNLFGNTANSGLESKLADANEVIPTAQVETYDANDVNGYSNDPNNITEAEKYMQNFPNELPGAKSVEKHPVPGAKRCLVHIGQIHDRPEIPSKDEILNSTLTDEQKQTAIKNIKEFYNGINSNQKNIYRILRDINEYKRISEIFPEGLTNKEVEESINQDIDGHFKGTLAMIKDKGYFENLGEYIFIAGGDYAFAKTHNIPVRCSEKETTHKFGELAIGLLDNEKRDKYLLQMREDALIDIISKQDSPEYITSFGNKHEYWDNIQRYNQEHPDNMISYIKVIPESYDKPNDGGTK